MRRRRRSRRGRKRRRKRGERRKRKKEKKQASTTPKLIHLLSANHPPCFLLWVCATPPPPPPLITTPTPLTHLLSESLPDLCILFTLFFFGCAQCLYYCVQHIQNASTHTQKKTMLCLNCILHCCNNSNKCNVIWMYNQWLYLGCETRCFTWLECILCFCYCNDLGCTINCCKWLDCKHTTYWFKYFYPNYNFTACSTN